MKAIADQAGVSLSYEGDEEGAPPAMMWNTRRNNGAVTSGALTGWPLQNGIFPAGLPIPY